MPDSTVQFSGTMHGQTITGEAVNPGDWFGKVWIIGHSCGFSTFFYAVEADSESDAIDSLVDSDHCRGILLDDEEAAGRGENCHYAGNHGLPVDLDNVRVYPSPADLAYLVDGKQVSPADYDSGD